MPEPPTPHPRTVADAHTDLTRQLVDLSDYTAALAEQLLDAAPLDAGELTVCARRIAISAHRLRVAALRAERADGASWGQLAAALGGEATADDARARYGQAVDGWLAGAPAPNLPGLPERLGRYVTRIPVETRAARHWLAEWRARRGVRGGVSR